MYFNLCLTYLFNFELKSEIIQAVLEALVTRDDANGKVSVANLKELLGDLQSKILAGISEQISSLQNEQRVPPLRLPDALDATEFDGRYGVYGEEVQKCCNVNYHAFLYTVKGSLTRTFRMVPSDFKFPKFNRLGAWNFWLLGMPDHFEKNDSGDLVVHVICPFCFLMLRSSHFR